VEIRKLTIFPPQTHLDPFNVSVGTYSDVTQATVSAIYDEDEYFRVDVSKDGVSFTWKEISKAFYHIIEYDVPTVKGQTSDKARPA
jgi:hypothetical protein